MIILNCNVTISDETLVRAQSTFMYPQFVQSDSSTAQVTYYITLAASFVPACIFLPLLVLLTIIHTQNFMWNQTTATRYSKVRRENLSSSILATIGDSDTSADHEACQNQMRRTFTPKYSTFDHYQTDSCLKNCSNMFAGAGHFKK